MSLYFDPQGVLIDFKDGPGWTLTDAQAGTLVTGSSGSGKTSGPGNMLRRAFLRSTPALPGGMGGIVFFAKNGEADDWVKACRKAKRADDVIRITPGGPDKFNFLDWIAAWGDDERGPIPTVALFEEMGSVVNPKATGGSGDNAFFEGAFRNRLANIVHLIQLAGLRVSLSLMQDISDSSPQTIAQGKSDQWKKDSLCWAALREAYYRTKNDRAAYQDFKICKTYLQLQWPSLSEKTRGVVDIMWGNVARPFLSRPLRPLFCEETTIRPEDCFRGKIFLIDIPVQEYHDTARLAAVAFKRCFQLAIMRRSGPPGSLRPAFLWADEAQNFLSPQDTEYQAVARSAGGVTCYLTQQISSLREAMGSADKAENLSANLSTKIFTSNSGETSRWASQLIGERLVDEHSINVGGSTNVQAGVFGDGSRSGGIHQQKQMRAYIQPIEFQKLKRGGKANNYKVEAVIFVAGQMFRGKNEQVPYKTLSFDQRDDEQ